MLRQAQHERSCLIRFSNLSVRPEPVEGRSKSLSATSRSYSTERASVFFLSLLVCVSHAQEQADRGQHNQDAFENRGSGSG
jgi:hypothetical protein